MTKDQFEDFKKKFIAESNRVRTQLTNAYKEGQLQLKKAQEDGYMKDKIIEASERENANLDALVKNIEQNNRNLLNANKNLQGAFDELRSNAKKEINSIKDMIQDTVDQSNQLNSLTKDKHSDNSNMDNKLDNLINVSHDNDNKFDELSETLDAVLQQMCIKSFNLNNLIADANKIKSENMLVDKQNKTLDLNLKSADIKNNKYSNQIDQMKNALSQSKNNQDKLLQDIDLLNKNLLNIYSTSSITKNDIDEHTLICSEYESANNRLLSIVNIIKSTDLDLNHDMSALRKRIVELDSRTTNNITNTYLSALQT